MAILNQQKLLFDNGRVIKLSSSFLAINSDLEISDGAFRNIFCYDGEHKKDKDLSPVHNPYNLTKEELSELTDCIIILCLRLKENIRKYGINSPEIFMINPEN